MSVVDEAVAVAWLNIGIRGYGSRLALRLAGTTWIDTTQHSRGALRPSFAKSFAQKKEGAGNAGCLLHPRSRVQ